MTEFIWPFRVERLYWDILLADWGGRLHHRIHSQYTRYCHLLRPQTAWSCASCQSSPYTWSIDASILRDKVAPKMQSCRSPSKQTGFFPGLPQDKHFRKSLNQVFSTLCICPKTSWIYFLIISKRKRKKYTFIQWIFDYQFEMLKLSMPLAAEPAQTNFKMFSPSQHSQAVACTTPCCFSLFVALKLPIITWLRNTSISDPYSERGCQSNSKVYSPFGKIIDFWI